MAAAYRCENQALNLHYCNSQQGATPVKSDWRRFMKRWACRAQWSLPSWVSGLNLTWCLFWRFLLASQRKQVRTQGGATLWPIRTQHLSVSCLSCLVGDVEALHLKASNTFKAGQSFRNMFSSPRGGSAQAEHLLQVRTERWCLHVWLRMKDNGWMLGFTGGCGPSEGSRFVCSGPSSWNTFDLERRSSVSVLSQQHGRELCRDVKIMLGWHIFHQRDWNVEHFSAEHVDIIYSSYCWKSRFHNAGRHSCVLVQTLIPVQFVLGSPLNLLSHPSSLYFQPSWTLSGPSEEMRCVKVRWKKTTLERNLKIQR